LSEFVIDDWHEICQTLSNEMHHKVKTFKGIEDLYLIRDDYLFNILAAVIDIQLQASVYKGSRSKKQIFCQLIEDVIKVAPFV
jgi:hypothetical protein